MGGVAEAERVKAVAKTATLPAFDWKNPEPCYELVWAQRAKRLSSIRRMPEAERALYLASLFAYYRENPWDFINDWGVTFDPRRLDLGHEPLVPFVLFPKQIEFCQYIFACWKGRKPGLADKSRDGGLSWLAIAMGCTLCLFNPGMIVGYGSRVEDYVDLIGEPKSLFWKARLFMQELPREFKGTWDVNRHAPHMRILFPNGSAMTGESGKQIGRGGRTSIFFVDEAAYLEHPKAVDAALSQTTNCRIDISTPNGLANPFAHKRHAGKIVPFTLHWTDDPRKDDAWYAKQVDDLDDPVVVAQEIDISYSASVEGVLIPADWVRAAIDAHLKTGIKITGDMLGALDVADEGVDKNAFAARHGVMLTHLAEWSGVGGDIFDSVDKVFEICDDLGIDQFRYDADGLGAGVRGDARVLNEARVAENLPRVRDIAFRGSGGVYLPEAQDVKGRKNKDYFKNAKAQGWWALRKRFRATYRWVTQNTPPESHDDIIVIPSTLPYCTRLIGELSQPTYGQDTIGKMLVNKKPNSTKSPDLADAVMMLFARAERGPMKIKSNVVDAARTLKRPRHRSVPTVRVPRFGLHRFRPS